MMKRFETHSYEAGLVFRKGEFRGVLVAGIHWFFDPLNRLKVQIVSRREPWLAHEKLDLMVRSGLLEGRAEVLDLKDHQRALVWIDGRFSRILPAGLYAWWTGLKDVRVEVVDARNVRFEHGQFRQIARVGAAMRMIDLCTVDREHAGVLFIDGQFVETLGPGEYAFWKGEAEARVVEVDLRQTMVDISGQEIMTADKVTLRMNAVVTYRVADPHQAVTQTDDVRQALYRESQLVLRSVVGARELDSFLTDREAVVEELETGIRARGAVLGLDIDSAGIRDVILPGDMKELMNRVMEARKAAEANLIARREETAAIRSQANSAKLLGENPVLMRMRELEVLEKIATTGELKIVLGEKGLAEKVMTLL